MALLGLVRGDETSMVLLGLVRGDETSMALLGRKSFI